LNILNFMKWFYKEEKIIKLLSNFPQQNNTYDCGVMMLSGIHYFIQHSMKKFKT
jgi:Ulp1 family protease